MTIITIYKYFLGENSAWILKFFQDGDRPLPRKLNHDGRIVPVPDE